jgi:hypothetical protein
MKSITFIFIFLSLVSITTHAQSTQPAATQQVSMSLGNVIEIKLHSNTISLPFTTVNDYANGVTSSEQQILVSSNKNFNVRVKSRKSRFGYAGNEKDPKMPLSVLKVKVASNQTNGQISSGHTNYTSLSTSGKNVITNATAGENKNFSVEYQAKPGFAYPAGTYSVDIIYTATQA